MVKIDHVIVPLDGSRRAERAVPLAAYLAATVGAAVEIVHVTKSPTDSVAELGREPARSIGEAEGMITTWTRDVNIRLLDGHPPDRIVERAAELDNSMVMMASHGRTGLSRRLFGSVTEDMLTLGKVPILIVKAQNQVENITFPSIVRNIILPVDGTTNSEAALSFGEYFASKLRTPVRLLHVGKDEGAGQTYLDTLSNNLSGDVPAVTTVYRTGEPSRAIVSFIAETPSPLTVMCSTRSTSSDASIGESVADYVARHTFEPLLIVPDGYVSH